MRDWKDELKFYEEFLVRRRGWVSRWPQRVVFLYSGGLDSTITIARLLEEKEIEIFPLFINRGQRNLKYERESAYFFEDLFRKKHRNRFHKLREINVNVPPKEIKKGLRGYATKFGYPLRNTILQMVGVQYALSLLENFVGDFEKITSVFCAQIYDDPFPHSTLISLRATTIAVCQNLEEWSWQITSPNIDKYLNLRPMGKIEMIKWALKQQLPIEKTRSCYEENSFHCGICLSCRRRRTAFREAGLPDNTKYLKLV